MRKCIQAVNRHGAPLDSPCLDQEWKHHPHPVCNNTDPNFCLHHVPLYAPTEERGEGAWCDGCGHEHVGGAGSACLVINCCCPSPSPESPAAEIACDGVTPPHDECAGGECAPESPAARLRREAIEALDALVAARSVLPEDCYVIAGGTTGRHYQPVRGCARCDGLKRTDELWRAFDVAAYRLAAARKEAENGK